MNEYKDVYTTPGAFSWCELMTSDPAAAASFYAGLCGWNVKEMGEEMGGYRVVSVGETGIGGIMAFPKDAPPMPPHWGCYITTADLEATVAKCSSLGGKVMMPGMDIPGVGRLAVLQDPQGAVFNAIQYAPPA
jgi:uncharacterized protein